MRHLNLALVFSILMLGGEVLAQNSIKAWIIQDGLSADYPTLYKVVLTSEVSYDVTGGFYFYGYTLTNDPANGGDIWMFEIDIRRHPGSVIYDTVGLKFANKFEQGQFRRYYPPALNAVESIGFPQLPNRNWTVEIAHNSVANFGTGSQLLKPDSSIGVFAMMSKALPGIRALTVYSYFDVGKYTPDIDADTTAALDSIYVAVYKYIKSMARNVNYRGWTIGPTAPPMDFSASSWIDTLISYKHQCLAQGWLTDNKTCEPDCDNIMNGRDWYMQGDFQQYDKWQPDNSWDFDRDWNNGTVEVLDARLNKAQAELSKKDSVDARQDLEMFVMEVEMLNDVSAKLVSRRQTPVMTSEVYALLKYNAEYLIDRLPDRRQRH